MKNSRFAVTRSIVVARKVNTNRPGSMRFRAYELARRSRTVADFYRKGGAKGALVFLVNEGTLRLRDVR
jgi:hypothetical protein